MSSAEVVKQYRDHNHYLSPWLDQCQITLNFSSFLLCRCVFLVVPVVGKISSFGCSLGWASKEASLVSRSEWVSSFILLFDWIRSTPVVTFFCLYGCTLRLLSIVSPRRVPPPRHTGTVPGSRYQSLLALAYSLLEALEDSRISLARPRRLQRILARLGQYCLRLHQARIDRLFLFFLHSEHVMVLILLAPTPDKLSIERTKEWMRRW